MMNLKKGIVTLSFDCEAKWGMADLDLEWKNQLTDKNLTEAYEYILDTLKKYNIPSSFAFVGGMTETKDNFLNKTEQLLNNKNHEKWLAPVFKAAQNNDEGWFLPHILDLCRRDEIHEIAEDHLCCGSAGTYNLLQPEIAAGLRDRKIGNIEATDARVVATGNIGCITQLQTGTTLPVVHTVQLLDWATGGPKPDTLLEF